MQPLMLLGSVLGVGLGAFGARKASRVRPELDAVRVVVSFAVIAAMTSITGVRTPVMLMFGALALGAVIGITQGLKLSIESRNGNVYATRTAIGIAIWGGGLLVTQVAAMMNRSGVFKVGQAVSYFSIAMTVGMYLGRHNKMRAGMGLATTGTAALAVLFVVGAMPLTALANDPPPPAGQPPQQNPCQIEPDGDVDCNDSSVEIDEPDYDPPPPVAPPPYQGTQPQPPVRNSGTTTTTRTVPSGPSAPTRPTDELADPIKGGLNQVEPVGMVPGDDGVTVQPAGSATTGDEIPPDKGDSANAAGTAGALLMGALGAGELLNNKKGGDAGKAGAAGAFAGATAAGSATAEPAASGPKPDEPESELQKLQREHKEAMAKWEEEEKARKEAEEARQKELEREAAEKAAAEKAARDKLAAQKAAADQAAAEKAAEEKAAAEKAARDRAAKEAAEERARAERAAAEREAAEKAREKAIAEAEAEAKKKQLEIEAAKAKREAEYAELMGKLGKGADWTNTIAEKGLDWLGTATGGPLGPGQKVKDIYNASKGLLSNVGGDLAGGSLTNPKAWANGVRDAVVEAGVGKALDNIDMLGAPAKFAKEHNYLNATISSATEGMVKDHFIGNRVKNVLKMDHVPTSVGDVGQTVFQPSNALEALVMKGTK